MRTFNCLDSAFHLIDTGTRPQHIAGLAIVDRAISLDQLKTKAKIILPSFPRLWQLQSIPSLDVLEGNGLLNLCDSLITEKVGGIAEVMETIMQRFETHFPAWKLTQVSSPQGPAFLLFSLHHSLADGLSALNFFNQLTEVSPNRIYSNDGKREIKKEFKPKYVQSIKHLLREACAESGALTSSQAESRKRVIYLYELPYSEIQLIKKHLGVSAFSIALAIFTKMLQVVVPSLSTMRPLIPVSVRSPKDKEDLRNKIGGTSFVLQLKSSMFSSVISEISDSISQAVKADAFHAYYLCAKVLSYIPQPIAKIFSKIAARRITAVCTSLNSSRKCLGDGTFKVLQQFAIPALMPGQALGLGVLRYHKSLCIAVIADPEIITEHEAFTDSLKQALELLSEELNMPLSFRKV